MTDFGRRTAAGTHAASHETGGADLVHFLLLADMLHAAAHENGGADEIDVAGLSGELADQQEAKSHTLGGARHTPSTLALINLKVSDGNLDKDSDTRTPTAHASSHEDGGADEIDLTGLAGGHEYVCRGDPAAHDWTKTTLTQDGNWNDLDCSSLVPAGAAAILFCYHVAHSSANKVFMLRAKGHTNNYNIGAVRTAVGGIACQSNMLLMHPSLY